MSLRYIKAYDGMRGMGALFIILYHWPYARLHINHGWEFMQMFFVLSGFLITSVLLADKQKYAFGKFALQFYVKRALRLFPIYYLYILSVIAVVIIFSHIKFIRAIDGDIPISIPYLLSYTYNWASIIQYFQGLDYTASPLTVHLWTLSLEEQFYLFFPFLIYFLNIKQLKGAIIIAIVTAPVWRWMMYKWGLAVNPNDIVWTARNIARLPPLQMDSLAFGAALAVFDFNFIKKPLRWFAITTALIFAIYIGNILYVVYVQGTDFYTITYGRHIVERWILHNNLFSYIFTLVNFWCMLALLCIKRGYKFRGVLEWSIFTSVGKYSYAIYIFHLPLVFLYIKLVEKYIQRVNINQNFVVEAALFFIYFALLLLLTSLSYTYIELYFLSYKNKLFPKK